VLLFSVRRLAAGWLLWLLAGDVATPGVSLLTAVDPGSSELPCRCPAEESIGLGQQEQPLQTAWSFLHLDYEGSLGIHLPLD